MVVRNRLKGCRSERPLSTRLSTFRVDDLQLERGYDPWRAYAQSKIATQVIGFELDRRLRASGSPVLSVVAHPGYSIGGRTPTVPGVNEPSRGKRFADAFQAPFAQGKHRGAEIVLHALTAPEVESGEVRVMRSRLREGRADAADDSDARRVLPGHGRGL